MTDPIGEPTDPQVEKNEISDATNIDELCDILTRKVEVQGSNTKYQGLELIKVIRRIEQDVKAGIDRDVDKEILIKLYGSNGSELTTLTRSEGLREKAGQLFEAMINSSDGIKSLEQESVPPAANDAERIQRAEQAGKDLLGERQPEDEE